MAGFFYTPKTRKFKYKPWFYNEAEEQRKERFAKIDKEMNAQNADSMGNVPRTISFIKFARQQRKKSNLRVLLILTALLLLFFILSR